MRSTLGPFGQKTPTPFPVQEERENNRLGGKRLAGGSQQRRRQAADDAAGVVEVFGLRPADVLDHLPGIQRHDRRGRAWHRSHARQGDGKGDGRLPPRCVSILCRERRLDRGEAAVEIGFQGPNPRQQRRMGGKEVQQRAGEGVAEEHVADLLGVGVANPRALGQAADLLQRPGNPAGIAGKLDRRGVGQELPLPADGALDQFAQEDAQVAQYQERQAEEEGGRLDPAPLESPDEKARPSA